MASTARPWPAPSPLPICPKDQVAETGLSEDGPQQGQLEPGLAGHEAGEVVTALTAEFTLTKALWLGYVVFWWASCPGSPCRTCHAPSAIRAIVANT